MKHTFAITIDTGLPTFNHMKMDAWEQVRAQLFAIYMIKNQGHIPSIGKDLKTHPGNIQRMIKELGIERLSLPEDYRRT